MRCIFETDAKALADACKDVQRRAYFYSIILSCVKLFKHYDHISENGVAHMLVRASHSMSGIQEWTDTAPDFISDALIIDLI